ncbi:MAG: peptide deformylase [Patescibacteria group bacterium]
MTLKILTNPNEVLRRVARDLSVEELSTPAMQTLIDEMGKTMLQEDGVGLAAPQIGNSIRLISVATNDEPQAFVNPKIVRHSFRKVKGEEGCLSVPGVVGTVARYPRVTVEALDRFGRAVVVRASGLSAIVFQHEIDHLDGILFIDKATAIHDKP